MAGNPNYDTDLLAATFGLFLEKQPKDAIFQGIPFLERLREKQQIKRKGGNELYEPLMYAKNNAGGSYSGYDSFNLTPSQGLTRSVYNWKYYEWTIMISGQEEMENAGESQMIDLLEARWTQTKKSMFDTVDSDLFLDGTGNASKKVTGLDLAIDNAGTYGGIVRSTNTWWQANETAIGGVLGLDGTTGLRRTYNACAFGQNTDTPDLLLTTQILYEAYEKLMDAGLRWTVGGSQNAVFETPNLMFRKAQMMWDAYCQSGTLYLINSDYMKFIVHSDRDFVPTDWKVPVGQDAKVAQILAAFQLVVSNCRRLGKNTGYTNT